MKAKRKNGVLLCCRLTTLSALSRGKLSTPSTVSRWSLSHWPLVAVTVKELRKHCPPAMPVSIKVKALPLNTLGHCRRHAKKFVIELNALMGQEQAIDTLLHEWSHALAWHLVLDKLSKAGVCEKEIFDEISHDETWGCAYSRVYRVSATHILPALEKAEKATQDEKREMEAQIREHRAKHPDGVMPEYDDIPAEVLASIKAKYK
jgi:hypothetical protein